MFDQHVHFDLSC